MKLFLHAHATHPQPHTALALAAAQIEAQRARPDTVDEPTIGWLYFSEPFVPAAAALLDEVQARWPGVAWVGSSSIGVAANGVEYFDEPALVLMLGDLPRSQFRLFSGAAPLVGFAAAAAQVHADPSTPDLAELIAEMADRTATGYLFGGLACGRSQWLHIADGIFTGGLSGIAFAREVPLVSRVTQGCQPIGPARTITSSDGQVVLELDGEPALDCLMDELGLARDATPREAVPRLRETLIGLSRRNEAPVKLRREGDSPQADAAQLSHGLRSGLSGAGEDVVARPGQFGADTRVRHLIGIDPARRAIAIADHAVLGETLAFCKRDTQAARRDLVRICAEIREEIEPEALTRETALALQGHDAEGTPHPARRIAGAVYVSCSGRGGPHFGAPSAELAIVRHALGDVPLVGFFAGGEIARHHLYGYTGVLTVFAA